MNFSGGGLMQLDHGSEPSLYHIRHEPEVVEKINEFITGHTCHSTFEVPSGKEIPLPVERRRWTVDMSCCQVCCFVTVTCRICNVVKEVIGA